jgi:hypothetical protein
VGVALDNSSNVGFAESLSFPCDVVGVVACVSRLPQPATDSLSTCAREVFGNMVACAGFRTFLYSRSGTGAANCIKEFIWCPSEGRWRAWHEMLCPVMHRSLQQHPIILFLDRIVARNHHPGLPAVIDREGKVHLHVFTWDEPGHLHFRCII